MDEIMLLKLDSFLVKHELQIIFCFLYKKNSTFPKGIILLAKQHSSYILLIAWVACNEL